MRAVGAASSGHVSVTGSARPVPTLMCSFFFCSFPLSPANGVRSQRWMRASSGPRARGAPSAGPRGPDHVRRRRAPYAVPRFLAVLRPCDRCPGCASRCSLASAPLPTLTQVLPVRRCAPLLQQDTGTRCPAQVLGSRENTSFAALSHASTAAVSGLRGGDGAEPSASKPAVSFSGAGQTALPAQGRLAGSR